MEDELETNFAQMKIPRSSDIHLSIMSKCSENFLSKYFTPKFFNAQLSAQLILELIFLGNKTLFEYFMKNFAAHFSICISISMIDPGDKYIRIIRNNSDEEDWTYVYGLDEITLLEFGFTYCPHLREFNFHAQI